MDMAVGGPHQGVHKRRGPIIQFISMFTFKLGYPDLSRYPGPKPKRRRIPSGFLNLGPSPPIHVIATIGSESHELVWFQLKTPKGLDPSPSNKGFGKRKSNKILIGSGLNEKRVSDPQVGPQNGPLTVSDVLNPMLWDLVSSLAKSDCSPSPNEPWVTVLNRPNNDKNWPTWFGLQVDNVLPRPGPF